MLTVNPDKLLSNEAATNHMDDIDTCQDDR
jgi:hypothetical protein